MKVPVMFSDKGVACLWPFACWNGKHHEGAVCVAQQFALKCVYVRYCFQEESGRLSGACVGHTDPRRARHTAMAEPGRVLAFLCAACDATANGAKRAIGGANQADGACGPSALSSMSQAARARLAQLPP
jgi:hypothetical protein